MLEYGAVNNLDSTFHTNFPRTDVELALFSRVIEREAYPLHERERINDALSLLKTLTFDQEPRESGAPAISHPVAVATHVAALLRLPRADTVIAALLHDTVEDNADKIVLLAGGDPLGDTKAQALGFIGRRFGPRVKELVGLLTNHNFEKELAELGVSPVSELYKERKRQLYAEHIRTITEDPDALLIKYCDFSHNAFHLAEEPWLDDLQGRYEKYYPVVQIFIDQFRSVRGIPITPNRQQAILYILDQEQKKMGRELQAIRAAHHVDIV